MTRTGVLTLALAGAVALAAVASGGDDAGPESVLPKLAAACKAGDRKAVAAIYGDPVGPAFLKSWEAAARVGKAKAALSAALDARFGKAPAPAVLEGIDDRRMLRTLTRTASMKIAGGQTEGDRRELRIELADRDGGPPIVEEYVAARRPKGGWSVFPRFMEGGEGSAKLDDLAKRYDALAKAVKAGAHASREDAMRAAQEAHDAVFGPKEAVTIEIKPVRKIVPDGPEAKAVRAALGGLVAAALEKDAATLEARIAKLALADAEAWFQASFPPERAAKLAKRYGEEKAKLARALRSQVEAAVAVRRIRTEAPDGGDAVKALDARVSLFVGRLVDNGDGVTVLGVFALEDGAVRHVGPLDDWIR